MTPVIPAYVLRCETCHRPIEPLADGLLAWAADDDGQVSELCLTHRGRCDSRLPLSAALTTLACPEAALHRLADMTVAYSWPGELLARLVCVAWAAGSVAPAADRRVARRAERVWGAL
jgi:hypothetical protein